MRLDIDAARRHCSSGIGMFEWASIDGGGEPDVAMACAGDVPTLETLAAVELCRQRFSDFKIRVVNVVDLMVLEPPGEHPTRSVSTWTSSEATRRAATSAKKGSSAPAAAFAKEATMPVETGALSISQSASWVRSTERCWAWTR